MTKLTPADLEALIQDEQFVVVKTLTICVIETVHGAQITGQSNCIDPANFDVLLGREYARKDAINKLWELEGYATKTRGVLRF